MSRWGEPPWLTEPPPLQLQRLRGWITMLDVDLEVAQVMLRRPVAQLPVPPIALPPIYHGDRLVAPVVEAPTVEEAAAPPRPVVGLRGAYARRAAARRSAT